MVFNNTYKCIYYLLLQLKIKIFYPGSVDFFYYSKQYNKFYHYL